MPISAIERVEVISDGASSIYGSDAVAGVINFILRKDYDGAEAKARYANSSTDGNLYNIDLTGGLSWQTGNFLATLNAAQEDAVLTQNVIASQDFRGRGGRDFRSAVFGPSTRFSVVNDGSEVALGLPAGTVWTTALAGESYQPETAINSSDPLAADLPKLAIATAELTTRYQAIRFFHECSAGLD